MIKLFVGVLGLGVAGFDPLGFVALMAAVTLGVKKRAVAVLLGTTLAVTAGVGVALSFGFGAVVPRLAEFVRVPHSSHLAWGLIFGGVGIFLLVWGCGGYARPRNPPSGTASRWRRPRRWPWRAPGCSSGSAP